MQSKARTYAAVMVQALDGVSERPARHATQGVAGGEATEIIRRFKKLLYKRGDFKHISAILREFAHAWEERKGKKATVVSAQPLAEKTKAEMQKKLEKTGYVLQERVDPSIIGGTALYLGNDFVIDGTIKGKLQRLEEMLAKKF